ncbi:MAG: ATP-binding protein [Planctomycetes bacterium]|nr:ATP-binding protein [Planctomycetota bacterium]
MFIQLEDPSRLPKPGSSSENETLDFKCAFSDREDRAFEMAKDVAAFANSVGGTILVGACEDRDTRTLRIYKPLDAQMAAHAEREYEAAIRALCKPVPLTAR